MTCRTASAYVLGLSVSANFCTATATPVIRAAASSAKMILNLCALHIAIIAFEGACFEPLDVSNAFPSSLGLACAALIDSGSIIVAATQVGSWQQRARRMSALKELLRRQREREPPLPPSTDISTGPTDSVASRSGRALTAGESTLDELFSEDEAIVLPSGSAATSSSAVPSKNAAHVSPSSVPTVDLTDVSSPPEAPANGQPSEQRVAQPTGRLAPFKRPLVLKPKAPVPREVRCRVISSLDRTLPTTITCCATVCSPCLPLRLPLSRLICTTVMRRCSSRELT